MAAASHAGVVASAGVASADRADCVVEVGETIVVFDDASRVRWGRRSPTGFPFEGTWPASSDRPWLAGHIERLAPLLVVLSHEDESVSVLREELGGPPPSEPADEVVDIRIVQLDWLGDDQRRRGVEFLHRERAAHTFAPSLSRAAIQLSTTVAGVTFLLRGPATPAAQVRRSLPEIVAWVARRAELDVQPLEPTRRMGDLHAVRG